MKNYKLSATIAMTAIMSMQTHYNMQKQSRINQNYLDLNNRKKRGKFKRKERT